MRGRQKRLPFALSASIRNPFSRELLRRCVLAQRPVSLDELAESMDGLRSTIRSHAEELEILGALKVTEELWPWRPSGHRYEATELLMNSEWALGGLGLLPGDRWLTDEARAEIDKHIAQRRNDKEFTERLRRRRKARERSRRGRTRREAIASHTRSTNQEAEDREEDTKSLRL